MNNSWTRRAVILTFTRARPASKPTVLSIRVRWKRSPKPNQKRRKVSKWFLLEKIQVPGESKNSDDADGVGDAVVRSHGNSLSESDSLGYQLFIPSGLWRALGQIAG